MIVVGVDGSAAGEAAVAWAADEAARRGDHLTLVHAWEDQPGAPYAPAAGGLDYARDRGETLLRAALESARKRQPKVPVRGRLLRGRPAGALLQQASGADLLVLGSGAHLGGDGRLGAVLLGCLRWPPCPVAVIQPPGRAEIAQRAKEARSPASTILAGCGPLA